MIALVEMPIDVGSVYHQLEDPASGAVVVFVGRVRNHHEGRFVEKINYTAYTDMVCEEGARIIQEARAHYPVSQVQVVHRVGAHAIGDISIVVGVASVHRADSFAAAAWIMDEIKKRLPIWKEEFYVEGDHAWPQNAPQS
jgi:molybdopterin synthase catalytic subunit